ncbi:MAG: HDOD domain-containing protein [Caldimicrobium sp.]|jgi:HD-like signal output (HDOD) protein
MSEFILERIFEKVDTLPPFPKTAQRALELLREEEVNYKELEEVIKTDPAIAVNFLKLVNSAAFSLPQKVDSLLKAFMLLGTEQIKLILLAAVAGKYFSKDLTGYGVSAKDIWVHSIVCGIIAEELAQLIKLPVEKRESLYMAALLHDLGKIILDLYTTLEAKKFYELMEKNPEDTFMQIEWLAVGVDHGMVGGFLLKKWEFPKEIYFSIRAHHDSDLMIQGKIPAMVALANILANMLGFIGGLDAFNYSIPSNLLEIIGIKAEELEKLLPKIYKRALLVEKFLV